MIGGRNWTAWEDEEIIRLCALDTDAETIAEILGERSASGVRHRAKRLGASPGKPVHRSTDVAFAYGDPIHDPWRPANDGAYIAAVIRLGGFDRRLRA